MTNHIGEPSDHDHSSDSEGGETLSPDSLEGTYPTEIRAVNGSGIAVSIDPSTSSTPVQDAVDALGGPGKVVLPMGSITEGQTLSLKDHHTIVAVVPGETTINFPSTGTSAHGVEVDGSADFYERGGGVFGVRIKGPGSGQTTGSGLHTIDSTAVPRGFNIGKGTMFEEWNGSSNGAVVFFDGDFFESDWGYWSVYASSGVHVATNGSTSGVGPNTNLGSPIFDSGATMLVDHGGKGEVIFDRINIGANPSGGSNGEVFALNPFGNSQFKVVESINYEPANTTNATATTLFRIVGSGVVELPYIKVIGDTLDEIVLHGFHSGSGPIDIGPTIPSGGATINTNDFVINSDTNGPVRYAGSSADVTNNTGGALTYPIHCPDGDVT